MSNTGGIDYDALAKRYGATSSQPSGGIDYDALAKQHGAISSTTYHGVVPQAQLDQIQRLNANPTQFEKDRNPENQPGIIHSAINELGALAKGAASMSAPGPAGVGDFVNQASNIAVEDSNRKADNRSLPYRAVAGVGSTIGVNAAKMEQQADAGNARGIIGTAIGDAAPVVAGEAVKKFGPAVVDAAKNVNPPLKGALASRMAEVPAGEQFSRQQVLDAARANGVNLDLAQATDSGMAGAVKKGNQYSLAAQNTYGTAQKGNLAALEEWANKESGKYAPEKMSPEAAGSAIQSELEKQRTAGNQRNATSLARDTSETMNRFPAESQPREVVGQRLQASLKKNLEIRQNAATQLFNDLDTNLGNTKPDASSVYDKAKQIIAENADYYEKNPALKQSRAWQIVNDLANRAEATKPTISTVSSKLVNEGGQPYTKQVTNAPKVAPDTWTDLQKLRTDLMNEYRSPDVAGSRAEGWLKQLAGSVDQSMTGAGSGLTGAELEKFRKANGIWEGIKSTYDNPQSPMYHAIRSGSPTQVVSSMEALPPEYTRGLQGSIDKETFTLFQKSYLERLLDPKGSGATDFAGLEKRVANMGDAKLKAVFGDHAPAIKRFSERATDIANAEPFGDASSPLNKAADARNPLEVVKTLSGGGPELARQVQATAGSLKGQFQRQFVENLLNDKNGNLDLGRLQQKLNGIPQDHLDAMIGADGSKNLRMLASVARKLMADSNPSGTAKVGVPATEISAMFHSPVATSAELATQYGLAKAINSKTVIDFLTKPRGSRQ